MGAVFHTFLGLCMLSLKAKLDELRYYHQHEAEVDTDGETEEHPKEPKGLVPWPPNNAIYFKADADCSQQYQEP
jgi:hypothetical protein